MIPREQRFHFGAFTFSRLDGLYRGKVPIPLRHLERQLLKCLLDRAGEIVRKEELLAAVWPDTHVAQNTLSVQMRRLRVTLKDKKKPYKLVKGYPRMGYMLVAAAKRKGAAVLTKGKAVGDKSRFIRDVTIPDGTLMSPGTRFEKIWEIQNVGSKPWANRKLKRVGACSGAGRLISDPETQIPDTDPGELCLVRMWLRAPLEPASYYAAWKMVHETGEEALPGQSPLFVAVDVVQDFR